MLLYLWHTAQNWTLVEVGFLVGFIGGFFKVGPPKKTRWVFGYVSGCLNPDFY